MVTNKIDWIDALRGYAVLGVVCVHSLMGDKGILLQNLFNLGAKGVQLFYIVSAFTLMLSFYNRKNEQHPTSNFFIRRFFRIAPMFYLAILYYLIQDWNITFDVGDYRNITWGGIISHFLLLHGLSPYWENSVVPGGWSVGVEIMFYLVCPFIFSKITNIKKTLVIYFIGFVVGQFLYWWFLSNPLIPYQSTWEGFLYSYFPTQFHVFIFGILAFYLVKLDIKIALNKSWFVTIPCIIMIFIQYKYSISIELLNNMIFGILFVGIIYLLKNNCIPILSNKPIRFLGKISYSMYLVHFAVLHWVEEFDLDYLIVGNQTINYATRLSMILIISIIISFIFYKIVETPFLRIGKNIISKRESNHISKTAVSNLVNL